MHLVRRIVVVLQFHFATFSSVVRAVIALEERRRHQVSLHFAVARDRPRLLLSLVVLVFVTVTVGVLLLRSMIVNTIRVVVHVICSLLLRVVLLLQQEIVACGSVWEADTIIHSNILSVL